MVTCDIFVDLKQNKTKQIKNKQTNKQKQNKTKQTNKKHTKDTSEVMQIIFLFFSSEFT